MTKEWKQKDIEDFINLKIEESLFLEYKAGDSLATDSDSKKAEITKDVAAMANSAGGTIIYGLGEYSDKAKKHLVEKLSPIDRTRIPKEWLEQVINGIRPRIEGVNVKSVQLDTGPNHVAYVVEIPQSTTAHQSKDHRYYKRYNFQSVSMEDHEIRDVMNRNKHPKIVPEFQLIGYDKTGIKSTNEPKLIIHGTNDGMVYAQYVVIEIRFPTTLLDSSMLPYYKVRVNKNGMPYVALIYQNTVRDYMERKGGLHGGYDVYGPKRYDPLLPSMTHKLDSQELTEELDIELHGELTLEWTVFADNALPLSGTTKLSEIPIDSENR